MSGDRRVDEADAYRDYVARWQRINAFQAEELKRLTPAERMRQFFALLAMARKNHWHTSTPAEVQEVRRCWRKLREAYLGKDPA